MNSESPSGKVKLGWWDQTYFETFRALFLSGELALTFRLARTPSKTLHEIPSQTIPSTPIPNHSS